MHLEKLKITQFKSYKEANFDFSPTLNCISGANGIGKTNILDAIYFLSLTKSAFQSQDVILSHEESVFFRLEGTFIKEDKKNQVVSVWQKGQRKLFSVNKKKYERLSLHIGKYPVVLVHPHDIDLVRDYPEERRKFFDLLLCQMDAFYLSNLQEYNHLLDQRNNLLKHFQEKNYFDKLWLESYDIPILEKNKYLYHERKALLNLFLPIFLNYYSFLTENKESVSIEYSSQVDENFEENFLAMIAQDIKGQRTHLGIHRDDYLFFLGGQSVKKNGFSRTTQNICIGFTACSI